MINDLIKQTKRTIVKALSEEPEAKPIEPAAVTPVEEPERKAAASYSSGEEVTAVVSAKECPHPKMLFIKVPDWEGLAITYVQDKRDWRTGDRMKVRFARMRQDYVLEFDGPKGPNRNKFGRRG